MSDLGIKTAKVLGDVSEGAANAFAGGLEATVATAGFLYAMPSAIRAVNESKDEDFRKRSIIRTIANTGGAFVGLRLIALQAGLYAAAAQNGQLKYLLIPAATNLASGMYEYFRNGQHLAYKPETIDHALA